MFRNRKHASADAAGHEAVVAQLRGLSFFEGFTDDEVARVAQLADDVEADAGALLIDQGRVGQECFVIVSGAAGVYVGDEHVATLGCGSMVGEMALIEHRPRNASVIAETPMRLLSFDTVRFRQLLDEMPKAHDRVMALLATRIKANRGG